jgi:hypothetical protein
LAHVAQRHDWSVNVHRYQDVYHPLLAKSDDCRVPAAA